MNKRANPTARSLRAGQFMGIGKRELKTRDSDGRRRLACLFRIWRGAARNLAAKQVTRIA